MRKNFRICASKKGKKVDIDVKAKNRWILQISLPNYRGTSFLSKNEQRRVILFVFKNKDFLSFLFENLSLSYKHLSKTTLKGVLFLLSQVIENATIENKKKGKLTWRTLGFYLSEVNIRKCRIKYLGEDRWLFHVLGEGEIVLETELLEEKKVIDLLSVSRKVNFECTLKLSLEIQSFLVEKDRFCIEFLIKEKKLFLFRDL